MKATRNGIVIAESDKSELIYIEGNWYFPVNSINPGMLVKSDTPYTCPWKGVCQYFDVGQGDDWTKDAAWSYPEPKSSAIDAVKKDFSNYVAFYKDVVIGE